MKRPLVIALLALTGFAMVQCVSPLEPDTPRTITPDPDVIVRRPPPVSGALRLNISMEGILSRAWGTKLEIQQWPTREIKAKIDSCQVATIREPYRYFINGSFSHEDSAQQMNVPQDDIRVHDVELRLNALELPLDSSVVPLDVEQNNNGNRMIMVVVYQNMNGGGGPLNSVDSLRTDMRTTEFNAFIDSCTIRYNGYDSELNEFTAILECKIRLKSSPLAGFLYVAKIILFHEEVTP